MNRSQSLWNREGRIPRRVNLVWEKITFSRLTLAYFFFSLVHCIIQVAFQTDAFIINKKTVDGLSAITNSNHTVFSGFLVLNDNLRLCYTVPDSFNTDSCSIVWNATSKAGLSPSTQQSNIISAGSPLSDTNTNVINGADQDDNYESAENSIHVNMGALKARQTSDNTGVSTCRLALQYPVMILRNTKREDVAFICFQIWVLGMSIVALLNESVPHIIASFFTHLVATAWAGFQLSSTQSFREKFNFWILNGACSSSNLVPSYWNAGYWQDRRNIEIPILVFNVVALILSAVLTWKLLKSFNWQTFKRVGASRIVNRLYTIVLTLSIIIQLSLFFEAVTLATWIDQLSNGQIGQLADLKSFYEIGFIVTLITLIPWLVTGWVAVRRELRTPMFMFLFLSIWFFAGFGGMFLSTSFRWTFMTWTFFGAMSSVSVILTLTSFILGLVCWYNFGRGLRPHLVKETLEGEDFVSVYPGPSDIERFSFPKERPLPTYS